MSSQWDIAVIGGGHNGLTAATYLAKSGRKVLVVERRDRVGGLAAGEEFSSGYRTAGVLHDTGATRPWVIKDLGLTHHGVTTRSENRPVLIPSETGPGYVHWRDPDKAAEEIGRFSASDAGRYREFRAFIDRVTPVVRRIFDEPLADVEALELSDLWDLGRKAVAFRLLGKKDMMELLRIAPMCAADWLREWFDSEIISAALVGPAIAHGMVAPWSPSTNFSLLLAEALTFQDIEGGAAALVEALEKAALSAGVEIRTGVEVKELDFDGDSVVGLTLRDGERISARQVVASCDPKTLFLDLIPVNYLPAEFEREVLLYRTRGCVAKVDLALSAYPEFSCQPAEPVARIRTGRSLNGIERSFDPVKYGQISREPMLDVFVPTLEDPGLAPAGHHVFSILTQWVPYELAGGWSDEAKEGLVELVVATLERYAPGLRDLVVGQRALSPVDLEAVYGVKGGHLLHGEHAADQLLTRPAGGCAEYSTPFPGLFLCGSGSHPGGGLTCAPGGLAARQIRRA